MDELQYRDTYRAICERRCLFEKAILARCCDCTQVSRFHLGDREGAACTDAEAHVQCAVWLERLRMAARFIPEFDDATPRIALSHRLQMKLQAGGLIGLAAHTGDTSEPPNVFQLLAAACAQYETLEAIPLADVLGAIDAFDLRRR